MRLRALESGASEAAEGEGEALGVPVEQPDLVSLSSRAPAWVDAGGPAAGQAGDPSCHRNSEWTLE